MPKPVLLIRFVVTAEFEFSSWIPRNAASIVLSWIGGDVTIVWTARSTLENEDQETDPPPVALNWIPPHGVAVAVLFALYEMRFPETPSAVSVPRTYNRTAGSAFTIAPAWIVNVAPGKIVTFPYMIHVSPVFHDMSPEIEPEM
ncbi:MAG: hypothetical protein L3J78_01165 [Thermoplasmata archaeon]|nr:hypothetical protein [Thermoplasmata archaeon]